MSKTLDMKLSQVLFGTVGLLVAFMMAFGGTLTANAQSNEDLENQVSSLLDTIEQLQDRLDALQNGNGGSTSTSVDYTFTSNLSTGSQGVDVLKLQQALNADIDTRLAATGAGAPGEETNYYGPITANAVTRFQEKYASEVLFPVGLTNGTGYFGPSSRAQMNALLAAGMGDDEDEDTDDDEDTDEDTDDEEEEDNEELEGGEASLEEFDFSSGDDSDVSEGNTADIAEIEFDVEDGDVMISRVDVSFIGDGEEQDPWDAFDEVALMMDGEEVASEDVSDEDDWLENDDEPFSYRFSGLDHIARDGDTVEMVVQVTAQDGVDGAGDDAEWVVFVGDDGVRATDGDDIEQYIGEDFGDADTFGEFDGEDNTVNFDIEEEGDEDEFDVNTSSNDPDASTIEVDEDDTSDNYNIFTFELSADDGEDDIEVDQLPVLFTVRSNAGTTTFNDVVDDMELEIDGETFDDYDEEDIASTNVSADTSASTTEYVVTFDIDDDYTLEAGDEVDVMLNVEFNQTDGNYENGTMVRAAVDSDNDDELDITGEGADDIVAEGSARGELHTLRNEGIFTENAETDTDSSDNDTNDIATFTFEFDTGAFEEDSYISRRAEDPEDGSGDLLDFAVNDSNGDEVSAASGTTSVSIRVPGADQVEDTSGNVFYRINDGDNEMTRITVTYDPDTASGEQFFAELNSIEFYTDVQEGDDVDYGSGETYEFTPTEDYETENVTLNN